MSKVTPVLALYLETHFAEDLLAMFFFHLFLGQKSRDHHKRTCCSMWQDIRALIKAEKVQPVWEQAGLLLFVHMEE